MNTALTRAIAKGYEGSVLPAIKTKIRWGLLGGISGLILAGYYWHGNNTNLAIGFLITAIFIPFLDSLNIYGHTTTAEKNLNYLQETT